MADNSISRLSPKAVLKLATLAVEAHLPPGQSIDKRSADEFSQACYWLKHWSASAPNSASDVLCPSWRKPRVKENGNGKVSVNLSLF